MLISEMALVIKNCVRFAFLSVQTAVNAYMYLYKILCDDLLERAARLVNPMFTLYYVY